MEQSIVKRLSEIGVIGIAIENGLIKIKIKRTNHQQNGDICYCNKELSRSTELGSLVGIENGFIKLENEFKGICYYSKDLRLSTEWAKSIELENGFVKLTGILKIHDFLSKKGIRYYTKDLMHSTEWAESIQFVNGLIKITHQKKGTCYYSEDLKKSTGWGDYTSSKAENGKVQIIKIMEW